MKKLIAILCSALLALMPALAEPADANAPTSQPGPLVIEVMPDAQDGLPTPVPFGDVPLWPDEEEAPTGGVDSGEQAIEITIDGERVKLGFDPSEQYSSIEDGLVQASFYTYSDDGSKLYVLYLIFPDSVQAGSTFSLNDALTYGKDSSVVLIVSDMYAQDELYYFASPMLDGAYPTGSDFAITIDRLTDEGGASAYAGRLTATLIALDMATGQPSRTLQIDDAAFAFTIGGSLMREPDPSPTKTPSDMYKT